MVKDMSNAMTRIETWFRAHAPDNLDDLAPGCRDAALAEMETLVGSALPEDFKELYRYHNGQMRGYSGIFYGLSFLSLEDVRRRWLGWKDLIDHGLEDEIDVHKSAKPGAVREVYANLGWIAFAHDGRGNHLGIDLAPGPAGTRGQVINFGRDENEKFVLAPSLSEFLQWLADQLESGNFLIRTYEYREYAPDSPAGGAVVAFEGPGSEARREAYLRTLPPLQLRSSLNTKDPPTLSFLDSVKVMFAWQRKR